MHKATLEQIIKESSSEQAEAQAVPIIRNLYTLEKVNPSSDSQHAPCQPGLRGPPADGPGHSQEPSRGTTTSAQAIVGTSQEVTEPLRAVNRRPSGEGGQDSLNSRNDSENLGHVIPHLLIYLSMWAVAIWLIRY